MHINDKEKFKETEHLFPFLYLSEIQPTETEMEVGVFCCCFQSYHIFTEQIPKIIISHVLSFVIFNSKKKFQALIFVKTVEGSVPSIQIHLGRLKLLQF